MGKNIKLSHKLWFRSAVISFAVILNMWKVALVFCFGLGSIQADFVPPGFEEVKKPSTSGDLAAQEKCGEGSQEDVYKCVEYHRCDPTTNTTIPDEEENYVDYSLLIDIRIGETRLCSEYLQVCCKIGDSSARPVTPSPPPPTEQPALSHCGIRNVNGIGFKIQGNTHNEAEYGEFPWMVAILKTNYNPSEDKSICGGSLIAPNVVLTGAHCVHKYHANDLKVRAGEWDTQTTNEKYPYQEQNVTQIILHEKFKDGVLFNDVALLVLSAPFNKAKHIATICLPDQNEEVVSQECYATGWGKNLFGRQGEYQVILKKIDLPIVSHHDCESSLRKTRLGDHFTLHESFICAGGMEGKDTCTGDGGSPLVCPDPKNPSRYVQAGIVAWGIGCGSTAPGVYASVAKFRDWVDGQVQRLNLDDKTYTS